MYGEVDQVSEKKANSGKIAKLHGTFTATTA